MKVDDISDQKLLALVVETDSELYRAGVDVRFRGRQLPNVVMKKLGWLVWPAYGPNVPPIERRIRELCSQMYRQRDVSAGGHIGVCVYRDIFIRIVVPHVYGTASVDPFKCSDLTPILASLLLKDSESLGIFLNQCYDVFDVEFGIASVGQKNHLPELSKRFLGLARLQLHAAAAILTGGYDGRGALQATLMAVELALKAAIAAKGFSEKEIAGHYRHDASEMVRFIAGEWPSFDADRVDLAIANFPRFSNSRYSEVQPDRIQTGTIAMYAQFIVSEVVRLLLKQDVRQGLHVPVNRTFP